MNILKIDDSHTGGESKVPGDGVRASDRLDLNRPRFGRNQEAHGAKDLPRSCWSGSCSVHLVTAAEREFGILNSITNLYLQSRESPL